MSRPDRTGLYPRRNQGGQSIFQRSTLPYTWERKWLWAIDRTCGICKQIIKTFDETSVDHIVPLNKGGLDSPDNLQLAHRLCNSTKGDKV